MTSTIAKTEVLKQDGRGRVRMPARRREALLDEFERSGSSGVSFARLAGIKYGTFAGWVQRRRKMRGQPAKTGRQENAVAAEPGAVRLFEAVVEGGGDRGEAAAVAALPAPSAVGLVIELPGGCRMSIESPVHLQMAAELVALVAQRTRDRC